MTNTKTPRTPKTPTRILSFGVKLQAPPHERADEQPASAATRHRDLVEIGSDFTTRLQLLWTYQREIGSLASATSFTNMAGVIALIMDIVESSKDKAAEDAIAECTFSIVMEKEGTPESTNVSTLIYEDRHLKSVQDRMKYSDAALRILHEAAVQQLVNSYERLMGDMVQRYIYSHHEEAAAESSIKYRDLLDFANLEEAKRKVVENQVIDFIRNNDTDGHLKYLREKLKADVQSHYSGTSRFKELVLRRHAIVHAGGIVTPEYVRRAKPLVGSQELPKPGTELELTPKYIHESWDTVYSMGVITLHLHARAEAQHKKDKEAEESNDFWLINAAYWAIQQGRYEAARATLEYAI